MKLSQKARLVILMLYAALLFCVCRWLFGTWFPPNAEKGLWLGCTPGLRHRVKGLLPFAEKSL
jgi:hypothetical protein